MLYYKLSRPTMYVSVLLVEANENQWKNKKNPSEKQCHLFRTCYAKEAVHSHFLLGETSNLTSLVWRQLEEAQQLYHRKQAPWGKMHGKMPFGIGTALKQALSSCWSGMKTPAFGLYAVWIGTLWCTAENEKALATQLHCLCLLRHYLMGTGISISLGSWGWLWILGLLIPSSMCNNYRHALSCLERLVLDRLSLSIASGFKEWWTDLG